MLNEALLPNDLKDLVRDIFEVDTYASKMGEDKDIVVVSFTVKSKEPADDLVNFIERGYDFVLDADSSSGELAEGSYKVFVEIERNRRIASQILEILNGISNLTGLERFKFRYFKNFHSEEATEENLSAAIPLSKQDYETAVSESNLNNFANFFNRSYLEEISVEQDDLIFQKKYAEPLRMKIKSFGAVSEMYQSTPGKIVLEASGMSEVMFLTKYLGNYNITKIGNSFIFENSGYAVVLERV